MKNKTTYSIIAVIMLFAMIFKAQTKIPCEGIGQGIGYSVACHTYCAPGTYNLNESFCNWQRITATYGDSTSFVFTVNGSPPTQTPSIIFTPGAPGITSFTLSGWSIVNGMQCHQQITWTFTTIVCNQGIYQGPVGILEYQEPARDPVYFDLQGNAIEKRYNELIIEQVGLKQRKVIFSERH